MVTAQNYDVVIVGAGLMGCFTARNLARYRLRIAVLERCNDVCMGISRANSAIVYAGTDTKPGTLKSRLTVDGNARFGELCAELGVPFVRCGSLMLASGPRAQRVLTAKLEQGERNGVRGLRLLSADELRDLEPHVADDVTAALWAPSTGTVNPWELCIAAAENAHANGVDFYLEHEVEAIEHRYKISCSNGAVFTAPIVINCAGLAAAQISEMVAEVSFRFKPTVGDYLILDDTAAGFISHVIFQEPEEKSKGATLVPTVYGNIMVGPSEQPKVICDNSQSQSTRAQFSFPTGAAGLEFDHRVSRQVFPDLPLGQTIRSFSTLRPNIYWAHTEADGEVVISDESISTFHIAEAPGNPGFINVAGIKTPGLTCADRIGDYVTGLVVGRFNAVTGNPHFSPKREVLPTFAQYLVKIEQNLGFSLQERHNSGLKHGIMSDFSPLGVGEPEILANLDQNSEIICRCCNVTTAEVRRAIHRPLGAHTVDGVKRRTGAGMGRCQGGFCTERIIQILAEELDCNPTDVLKDGAGSTIVVGSVEL